MNADQWSLAMRHCDPVILSAFVSPGRILVNGDYAKQGC